MMACHGPPVSDDCENIASWQPNGDGCPPTCYYCDDPPKVVVSIII